MPPMGTFFDWMDKNEQMAEQYARAMQFRAMLLFEDILDDAEREPMRMESKFGTCVDPGDVQNKRVKIDAKKWIAAKMYPKKYGDNVEFYEKLKLDKEREEKGDSHITIEIVE